MRRSLPIHALLVALAVMATAPAAARASGGGTSATQAAPAPAATGGSSAATGGSAPTGRAPAPTATGATGGHRYGQRFDIPAVIRGFRATPHSVTWGGGPTILRFRVTAVNRRSVRVVLLARRAGHRDLRVNLGTQRTNRGHSVRWARIGVDAGRYTLVLTALDARGRSVAHTVRAALTVRAKPRPRPRPTPAPSSTGSGVFPVRGPHSFGDGFGVDRGDHIHQGQDIPAADGTPLVAPRRSTVTATGYGGAAGEYVVLFDSDANRSYVYFHLHRGSTVVSDGQTVGAGQRIGSVGSTGDATGPHLHFELWIGRWFDGGHAVDPLPTLRSWGG